MTLFADHARALIRVRSVALGFRDTGLYVLLCQPEDSSTGTWRLPAGLVNLDESLQDAARRQLAQRGIAANHLEQLCGSATLAPNGLEQTTSERCLAISYYAPMALADDSPRAHDSAAWFPVVGLPNVAVTDDEMIGYVIARLRDQVRYAPVAFQLLPHRFSLTQLQRVYEAILGAALDKRNFRKKLLATKLVIETHEVEQGVRHRAARLYRFDRAKYDRLAKDGLVFTLQ